MKFLISIILIALLSFSLCIYLPWWSIAIAAFIISIAIPQSALKSFCSGFIALFLLWGCFSFIISYNNAHLLAHKVALLILKIDNPYILIFTTALIGAIVAGFASLTGSFIRTKNK